MKKIFLFIAAIALVSCEPEVKIDYAILTGTITNTEIENVTLYKQSNFSIAKKMELSKDGTFNDTIKLNEASLYFIAEGRNTTNLYLTGGTTININYNANDYKNTVQVTGNGAEYTNYLAAKMAKSSELKGEGIEVYKKEEAAFKETFQNIKQAQEDLLYSYDGFSEEFKQLEKRNINYEYLGSLNMFKNYHSYYAKKPDFETSEGFLDEVKGLDYSNEEDFSFSSSYNNLVSAKYSKMAQELMKKDSLDYDIAMLTVSSNIKNETIKNALLYNTSKNGITFTDDLESFYKMYMESSTNKENKEEITKSYTALQAVSKGKDSPKFTDYENNAGGTTSLDDLKGKYVYIDVWATWCGPCIAEIPSLKKIEKDYHNKNIEFVSLSIDDKKDHDKWKQMIVDKELGGTQLFADNNWESKFIQDYLIKGIPRFILIDPAGKIVSSNAPRPSNKKLTQLFDELKI